MVSDEREINPASMIILYHREETGRGGDRTGDHPFSSSVRYRLSNMFSAEPHSSFGSVVNLRTGGRWFDPRLGQFSFQGSMTVIATGFIPLSPRSVVTTMVMWESSQWFGKNIVQSTSLKRNPRKHG